MFIIKFWLLLVTWAGVFVARGLTADTLDPSKSLLDGQTLTSVGGTFELGFFRAGNSNNRYLGIWYREIPDQPKVWVANRDAPLNSSTGILNLSTDGNLMVLDKAKVVWSTGTSNATYPTLQILDSGNLILTDGKKMLWQSFDHPCDTFLPEMKIGVNLKSNFSWHLTPWKSDSDPSPGDYTYGMETHGIPEVFIWKGSDRIFRTGPWDGKGWSGRPDMATNGVILFHFFANESDVYYTFESLDKTVLGRAVLNESGVLQRWVWSNTTNKWTPYWTVPSDPCDQYATCGANGFCTNSYSPICQCLPGFTPKSPIDWNLRDNADGCARRTALNCSSDGFWLLQNVKLPDTYNATAMSNKTLDECHNLCQNNCDCVAFALIRDDMCLFWPGAALLDIRVFTSGGNDLYLRLAASDLDQMSSSFGKKISSAVIATATSVLAFLLLLCVVGSLIWLKRTKNHGKVINSNSFDSNETELELPLFDFVKIRTATNDFSEDNIIGKGGFGPVYKGKLGDGKEVAIKRLAKGSAQGIDEFKTEVLLIAKLQHRNLVRLLGCCIENEERMLVYEYMRNKSLDTFIFDERKSGQLNWQKRLDIIIGIARGLVYLHHDSRLKIIHRDLKASNILLDDDLNPKISDFGVARAFSVGQTEGNTVRVMGTCGYMSPEYAMGGLFSEKLDVYSFGVILLEILSGKKNSTVFEGDQRTNLLGQAWKVWKEGGCLDQLVAESIGDYPASEALQCLQVGLLCVQEGSEDRPTMHKVLLMLSSESSSMPLPNRPGVYVDRSLIGGGGGGGGECSSDECTMTVTEDC